MAELFFRFVGPATTVAVHCNVPPRVEVRTEGEAVSEMGQRLAYLVLTLEQLDLMNRAPPRVCVAGPPGTGKTILLVLMGLKWLREGHDVHVFSPYPENRGASYMIRHQLQMTLRESTTVIGQGLAVPAGHQAPGDVKLHRYDFYNGEAEVVKAVQELSAAAAASATGTLCVLFDEAGFGKG